ncbi:N-acyl amino acid synthase FeeM domain-containing protein [Bradyrhizobium sp. HKCCYLS20291]|uniref:N-acyl amino acid synthase FeeM domain-containing protein n=1 Tax=Bradyrhizobium sp. HKCCYLS20291 TaxID=3420766 RepID=UPI003EB89EF5
MGAATAAKSAASMRGLDLLDHVDYRLAQTAQERDEIYHLRYRAYLREGAVHASADERVFDEYDELPSTWIFGVHVDGQLCSSIRINIATPTWRKSPSVDVFGDIMHPKLDQGLVFVDSTRFVADPDKARTWTALPYVTVRLGSMAGVHFDADYGLAMVRPEHQAFYHRVFLHETWGPPRLFPGLVKPVGLMASHLPTVRERVLARYPFLHSTMFERRMLFDRPSPDAFSDSFRIHPVASVG